MKLFSCLYFCLSVRSKVILEKNHMLLPLALTVSRFSLLPVATPSFGGSARTFNSRSSISSQTPNFSKTKPRSILALQPHKKALSSVPTYKNTSAPVKDSSGGRAQGFMDTVAGLGSHQPKAASELLASASNFITGFGLSLATGSSPTTTNSSPKKN